jgi:hypothetical protein
MLLAVAICCSKSFGHTGNQRLPIHSLVSTHQPAAEKWRGVKEMAIASSLIA